MREMSALRLRILLIISVLSLCVLMAPTFVATSLRRPCPSERLIFVPPGRIRIILESCIFPLRLRAFTGIFLCLFVFFIPNGDNFGIWYFRVLSFSVCGVEVFIFPHLSPHCSLGVIRNTAVCGFGVGVEHRCSCLPSVSLVVSFLYCICALFPPLFGSFALLFYIGSMDCVCFV